MENYLQIEFVKSSLNPDQGISKPVDIIATDGKEYILKNNVATQNGKEYNLSAAFVNEYLSYQIAKFLGIPTPDFALLKIDDETLDSFPDLRFKYKFNTGIYLAIRKIEDINTQQLLKIYYILQKDNKKYVSKKINSIYKTIKNKKDIPKIIYFDLMTFNIDRFNNGGNLIFQTLPNGEKIISIDYGFCFNGPFWNDKKLNFLNNCYNGEETYTIFKNDALRHHSNYTLGFVFYFLTLNLDLKNKNPFYDVYQQSMNISKTLLTSWLNGIPNEWIREPVVQKQAYLNFIYNRIPQMPEVIDYFNNQGLFNKSTKQGEKLLWNEPSINIQ